jgi:hypothetical protein
MDAFESLPQLQYLPIYNSPFLRQAALGAKVSAAFSLIELIADIISGVGEVKNWWLNCLAKLSRGGGYILCGTKWEQTKQNEHLQNNIKTKDFTFFGMIEI